MDVVIWLAIFCVGFVAGFAFAVWLIATTPVGPKF